jgi:TonB family protein
VKCSGDTLVEMERKPLCREALLFIRSVLTVVLFAVSFCPAQQPVVAAGSDVAAELTRRYADKTLALRHAIHSDSQTFDSTGKLLTSGEEGPWTLYSGFFPTKFSLSDEELQVQGQRLLFVFDPKSRMMQPAKTKERVQLTIQLSKPIASANDAEPLMHSVFAMTSDEFIKLAPDYWQPFLKKQEEMTKTGPPALLERKKLPPGFHKAEGEKDVFRVDGKEVRAPRARYTPEPSFSEAAKKAGLQGSVLLDSVIDQNGRVARSNIVRPLGLGLDEQAIATVKTWRFKPATKDGHPVAVEINIEVQFNLFN